MNDAYARRDEHIRHMSDRDLLKAVIASGELGPMEAEAFRTMRAMLYNKQNVLTHAQRRWVEVVARRVLPLEAADAPRGREVSVPAVLQNLPKAPPGRKS